MSNRDNTKIWYKDGVLHRGNDLPTMDWDDGTKYWYQDSRLHRECNLPAVEKLDGSCKWYRRGQEVKWLKR